MPKIETLNEEEKTAVAGWMYDRYINESFE